MNGHLLACADYGIAPIDGLISDGTSTYNARAGRLIV
jgi:hypothetical protein